MKFYEYIKTDSKRVSKIFGLPFYVQTKDPVTKQKSQMFFGGIISTHFSENLAQRCKEKVVKILGKKVFAKTDDGIICRKYLFWHKICEQPLADVFYKKYGRFIDKKHDDIYILNANSGEIYLFLTYLFDGCVKKNKSKNPLIIATKKYHAEMINLICPEVDYILIEKIKPAIGEYVFSKKSHRFFMIFPFTHYLEFETDIKGDRCGQNHYFSRMSGKLGLSFADTAERAVRIPQEVERSLLEKIQKTGLNRDNFVFIAPEAYTCSPVENSFWTRLINEYRKRGVDVFVNLTGSEINIDGADYKTCKLSYAEAFALARCAKKIISLRSGFTEFLMQTNVLMITFYTKFRNRPEIQDMSVEQIMQGFGLSKLPHSGNIREYAFDYRNQEKMLNAALQ